MREVGVDVGLDRSAGFQPPGVALGGWKPPLLEESSFALTQI